MTTENIKKAKDEAKRFLSKVAEFEKRYKADGSTVLWGTKETGALKRSSLDLSRALSSMRSPL